MRFWTWLGRVEWAMASIGAGLSLFLIMMLTVISVFGRYVLATDLIPGAYNMIERIAFPLLVFWAIPLAHREGAFPRFELLSDSVNPLVRSLIAIFVLAVEIVVMAVLLRYLASFAWSSFESGRQMQIGTGHWIIWPVIAMAPLAFALILLEMLRLLWREIKGLKNRGGEEAS